MLADFLVHAEADAETRLLIDARIEAETVVHATVKSLSSPDFGEIAKTELVHGEIQGIESALAGLKAVLNSSDREAVRQGTLALNEATQHLAEVIVNRSVRAALSGRSIDQL
jgi:molecular chaperone HscA